MKVDMPLKSKYDKGVLYVIEANILGYNILVSDFELQSRYYVHFRANTFGKGMKPLILPPSMGSSTRTPLALNNPRRVICD